MLEQYTIVKAIQHVISCPGKSFSIRGLAASIKISPGSAREALGFMEKKGIVTLKIIGKTHQYRADLENPLCRQWKVLFNLDFIADSKLVDGLLEKIPSIQTILLYGSFAKGTNDEKSDLDLLVIAHKTSKMDFGFLNKTRKEINISLLSLNEWKKKALQDRVFYENVIYDSVVLHGANRPVVL
ncbi:MAG: nucleotidyltransferase domain-containing protein [Candidatus ainarchaeum sp.]|nr:nucleotidyltransferase domain-containing protein [Candidatus ainarchaeum sp.]